MTLYRRAKFLEILHEIREEMSREVDYDMDLFAETVRTGSKRQVTRKKNDQHSARRNALNPAETDAPNTQN